jgi:hypothetical protein
MPIDNDDDDEEEEMLEALALLQLMVLCAHALFLVPIPWNQNLIEQRLLWDDYCTRHEQQLELLQVALVSTSWEIHMGAAVCIYYHQEHGASRCPWTCWVFAVVTHWKWPSTNMLLHFHLLPLSLFLCQRWPSVILERVERCQCRRRLLTVLRI